MVTIVGVVVRGGDAGFSAEAGMADAGRLVLLASDMASNSRDLIDSPSSLGLEQMGAGDLDLSRKRLLTARPSARRLFLRFC